MKKISSYNAFILLAMVFMATNMSLSGYLITRSIKAQHQREETLEQIGITKQLLKNQQEAVKSFECILLIQPHDRTAINVEECHK